MKTGWKLLWISIGTLLLVGGMIIEYVWQQMKPLARQEKPITITFKSGLGIAAIASELEVHGIIRNAQIFKGYLKWNNEGSIFQAGTYSFYPGVSYEEIITKLKKGDVIPAEMIRFTIPEGYTIKQIADRLSKSGLINKQRFLKLVDHTDWLQERVSIVKHIPHDTKLKYSLEGYLFPETYELKKNSSEEEIIIRTVQETEKRLRQVSPTWQVDLKQRGMSLHALLTIASLIEREVVLETERPLVAGIINNRLVRKMPLQICATVQYILDKPKERLYVKDLKLDHPYNTYFTKQLPPGPIASPGIISIQAALKPKPSNYLFYVTKKDGSKAHLFATTYREHIRNIKQSKKNHNQVESGVSYADL